MDLKPISKLGQTAFGEGIHSIGRDYAMMIADEGEAIVIRIAMYLGDESTRCPHDTARLSINEDGDYSEIDV
jgi:hypothetical protein